MKLLVKFLLAFFSLALLLGAPLLFTVKNTVHQILLQDVEHRGILRATDMAEAAAGGFEAQSERMLLPALQSAMDRTGAMYAVALNPSGQVIAHTNVAEKGKRYTDATTLDALRSAKPSAHALSVKGDPVLDVYVPVWGASKTNAAELFILGGGSDSPEQRRLGTVELRLPLNEILDTQYRLYRKIAATVLAAGALALVFILLLMRPLLLRIRSLSEATSRIRHGEYGMNVAVNSKDELGQLSDDFNRMSKALAETTVSKDYFSGVLDNLADPLIVTTPDTIIRDANPATLRMLGCAADDVVGRPLATLCADASPLQAAGTQEQLRESSLKNVELQFRAKDGTSIPVLLSSSVLKDGSGQVIDIIVTVRDVTERKRLEGLVRQTDKMSAVGQLAAGVAHEINNPLGVILGFVETIEQDLDTSNPLVEPMRAVIRETLRCKNLVQNLLTFSRDRKPGINPEDPVAVVENALSLVETQARVKNVDVVRQYRQPLENVFMDRNQIEQVVINLCTNAMDAMPDGGRLSVGLRQSDGWLEIRVADTGTGIPPEIQQRIFEPFFSTKELGKGTGLGLSIVYETVNNHQGTIEVQSEKGKGATFIVRLPIQSGPAAGVVET
jgi:two-component system NtrC family sensor kinase